MGVVIGQAERIKDQTAKETSRWLALEDDLNAVRRRRSRVRANRKSGGQASENIAHRDRQLSLYQVD